MGYRISFKDRSNLDIPSKQHKEWLQELRSFLPSIFDEITDDRLVTAWESYSRDYACAGWLEASQEAVDHFVSVVDIIDEDTNEVVEP